MNHGYHFGEKRERFSMASDKNKDAIDAETAIVEGNLVALKELLSKLDVNHYIDDDSLLHIACSHRQVKIVKFLLHNGALANARTYTSQCSPLHIACRKGDLEVVKILLESGADINAHTRHRSTPVREVCLYEHDKIVEFLLKHKCDLDIADRTGRTPLITSVERGNYRITEMLLQAGCDKDKIDCNGRSAVFHAARQRQMQILQLLIDHGVNCNIRDRRGLFPLHVASDYGYQDVVKILLSSPNCDKNILAQRTQPRTPLWVAAQNGHLKVVEILLDAGADPDIGDDHSMGSCLFALLMSNHCRTDILQAFLEAGIDVNYTNIHGYSSLHFTIDKGWLSMAEILVAADVKIHLESNWLQEYASRTDLNSETIQFIQNVLQILPIPKYLLEQCREAINRVLYDNRPMKPSILQLPIAPPLKDYLLYRK